MSSNPRQSAGRARKRAAERFAAMGAECGICRGARGPIDYAAPRSHLFPLSLVIDEIVPVARWREGGYESPRACACDPSNWQPAHWVCNAVAGDKRGKKQVKSTEERADAVSGTF